MVALVLFLLTAAPDLDALAKEYLSATPARREAIREELKGHDELTADQVAEWQAKLLAWGRKTGRKLPRRKGTNYFYDKKTKRGKYIVGGGNGKGGLIIALHGGGKGQGDAGGAAGTFAGVASKLKCVCIAPEVLVKSERGWTTDGTEEFVLELIEQAKKTWKIDPDRVYMVGHSMGGYGSWTVGAHHADLFAGLAPFAGAPTPITEDGAAYGKVIGLVDGVIPNLRNVALHVYQSLDDKNVPPEPNVFANKVVLEWQKEYGGYRYKYVEVDGRGHGAPPGGHGKGVAWVYESKRDPRPKHILWQPVLKWKRMFYWLRWQQPEPRVLVEAKIAKPNEIDLDLQGASREGFGVHLDGALVDLDKEVVIREGGDEVFRGKVTRTLTALLICAAEKYDARNLYPVFVDLSP
ncbi:MAG: hypothetical protein ACYS0F_06560 [Planctomycetota bacterium]|jgi:hypothetical protein